MSLSAPFRFVPLSSLIVFPEWADKVSHDRPFCDGISGELNIQIHNTSPLCVGGQQDKSSEQEAGRIHFYRTPDNRLAIPGSGLKGMLRNVLEIASFSRFKQVEDQKLGVRDISEANNFYAKAMKHTKAGWLNFDNGEWRITPCDFIRAHQEKILEYFDIKYLDWKECKSAPSRYKTKIGVCPEVKFTSEEVTNKGFKYLANLNQTGHEKGRLVMTGQPGKGFLDGRSSKKYEFVFKPTDKDSIAIAHEVMSGFMQIHERTEEWQFWLSRLSQLELGIPVFWQAEGTQVGSLGLAMMYKIAYKNSIHDAIGHTSNEHLLVSQPDLADLIFGYIRDADGVNVVTSKSLKGRVNILTAQLNGAEPALGWTDNTVLGAPKPTYYPLYIRQDTKQFQQLMEGTARLSGWKRYQAKPTEVTPAPAGISMKTQVKLEQLPEGHVFNGKIVFHNLRPIELGALVWSLTFGGRKELRHAVGIGKPYGLGQVHIDIDYAKLRFNNQQRHEEFSVVLEACQKAFVSYMDGMIAMLGTVKDNGPSEWIKTGEMAALLEYAKPTDNPIGFEYLPTPTEYARAKKTDNLENIIDTFHRYQPTERNQKADLVAITEEDLSALVGKVLEDKANMAQKVARQEKMAQVSDEEKELMKLEDYLDQLNPIESATKSSKKNTVRDAKEIHEAVYENFDDEQKQRFWHLVEQINALLDDKQLKRLIAKKDQ